MTDTFFHICKHVLRHPNMNTNVTKFIPEFSLYAMDDDEWIFYDRFLRPLMYKVYAYDRYSSQSIITRNIMKLEWYINMYRGRDKENIFSFREKNTNELYDKHDKSFRANICRRNPNVASQSAIDLYVKCQRYYHTIVKFVNIIKMRYIKAKNQFDLLLRPISENDKNIYVIIQSNTKYLFRVSEFQQIIVTCIGNTSEYFPLILDIKNPYNNMKINENILYNFYFYLKANNYKIDELFNAYFNSGFNNTEYISKYEIIIRDRSITNEVKNGHYDKLYPYVLKMFLHYKKCIGNIHISCGFPRKKLVDLMRPYLHLYFYQLYYPSDLPRKYDSEYLLEKRLRELSCVNPYFGERTVIHSTTDHGETICFARYNCLVPGFYKKIFYFDMSNNYFTIELKDDNQYHKMMTYFNSSDISLVKHTSFHSSEMEQEYGFYIDRYYHKQLNRKRLINSQEESDNNTDQMSNSDDTLVDSDDENENLQEEKDDNADQMFNSDDTLVDSDDELESTNTNQNIHVNESENRLNNIGTNTSDSHEAVDNNNDYEPRTFIPVPFQPIARTELQITSQHIPIDYMLVSNNDNVRVNHTDYELHSLSNHDEMIEHHREVVERVMTTFNELTQRLHNITSPPNVVTANDDITSHSMSICEPSDDEYERNSVIVRPTIENVIQCNEENNSDISSIETDPDVKIISNNICFYQPNEENKRKYIVRAMSGSREAGYKIELIETFHTEDVANLFYESIELLDYTLKEIEFVPFGVVTSDEIRDTNNIINCEEIKNYDPSKYENNNELTETTFENRIMLDMFLCYECKLQSIKNKCYICNTQDICNYCNGEHVWSRQNNNWICRDCHNNCQQEEYNEDEIQNEEEDEMVTTSFMTYGIPANADMPPEEYMRDRIKEITRDAYLELGFTEEDYAEMQDLCLEEYGSDGECEDY